MGLIILICLCVVFLEVKCSYSNTWLVNGDLSVDEVELLCKRLGFRLVHQLGTGHFVFEKENLPKISKRKDVHYTKLLKRNPKVNFVEQEEWLSLSTRQASVPVSDPMWPRMWYINNGTYPNIGILDMWLANYTGQGVTIGIVDDGVEYTHTDLTSKYDKTTSYDFYAFDNDPSPSGTSFDHGTKCAGVALAEKNNVCGIGAAYNSKLSALRLLGPAGARKSGQIGALTQKGVDIFSNSWGGTDGKFEGPSPEVAEALRGGTSGNSALRGGKGAIYVFPAGNGGSGDDCNTDGYVNSIYTIGIFGVARDHESPGYAESCSAALASAFTGKGGLSDNIITTSVGDGCMDDFTGTSAAASLAAGTLALLLQANGNLSWRDVQELIIRTSRLDSLKYSEARLNGVGRNVSHLFGYGLLDVAALIREGKSWTSLGKQNLCSTATQVVNQRVDSTSSSKVFQSSITTDGCNATANCVNRLEHVQARVNFSYSNRGSVELKLTSPMGTISTLLKWRSLDTEKNSQQEWVYKSVHHWGEDPLGTWTLTFSVAGTDSGKLEDWDLRMFGTGEGCTVEETTTDSKCNFDNDTYCMWHNVHAGDNFDWTLHQGETPSENTGPTSDHTTGTLQGKYYYIETSAPRQANETAWLQSEYLSSSSGETNCLQFWYNMFGTSVGYLNVLLSENATMPGYNIWSIKGNQGPTWTFAQVTVTTDGLYRIIFEGTVGNGNEGDIALDDISFEQGNCSVAQMMTSVSSSIVTSTVPITPMTGFIGQGCYGDPCVRGVCYVHLDEYFCLCPSGFQGINCEIDIDECRSTPCTNGATCKDSVDMFICHCPDGYTGHLCETYTDPCSSNPCVRGKCFSHLTLHLCICPPGYSGQFCEKHVDHCASHPCENNGHCSNVNTSYTCECPFGFSGQDCSKEHGTKCFACTDKALDSICNTVTTCNSDESCYVETFLDGDGSFRYDAGCRPSSNCLPSTGDNCTHCCETDYCNDNGCGLRGYHPASARGPICFDCDDTTDIAFCKQIKACFPVEMCTVYGSPEMNYDSKCISKNNKCDVQGGDGFCQYCCNHDFCNRNCTVQ